MKQSVSGEGEYPVLLEEEEENAVEETNHIANLKSISK